MLLLVQYARWLYDKKMKAEDEEVKRAAAAAASVSKAGAQGEQMSNQASGGVIHDRKTQRIALAELGARVATLEEAIDQLVVQLARQSPVHQQQGVGHGHAQANLQQQPPSSPGQQQLQHHPEPAAAGGGGRAATALQLQQDAEPAIPAASGTRHAQVQQQQQQPPHHEPVQRPDPVSNGGSSWWWGTLSWLWRPVSKGEPGEPARAADDVNN